MALITPKTQGTQTKRVGGVHTQTDQIYNASAATDDGVWFNTLGYKTLHIIIVGASWTGTVSVGGSNADTIPANSADGFEMDVTSSGVDTEIMYDQYQMAQWMKIHHSARSAGSVTVEAKVVYETG